MRPGGIPDEGKITALPGFGLMKKAPAAFEEDALIVLFCFENKLPSVTELAEEIGPEEGIHARMPGHGIGLVLIKIHITRLTAARGALEALEIAGLHGTGGAKTMDASSWALSFPTRSSTSFKENSIAVPGPRLVTRRPSTTTRSDWNRPSGISRSTPG